MHNSKIQALFYILFNAGVSNFDINKSHPQWGSGLSADNGVGYTNMPISFKKVLFTVAGSDEVGIGAGDSKSTINAFAVSNNTVGLTSYDSRNDKYWANGIRFYTVGLAT